MGSSTGRVRKKRPILDTPLLSGAPPSAQIPWDRRHVTLSSMHSGGHSDSKEVSLTLGNIIVSERSSNVWILKSWKIKDERDVHRPTFNKTEPNPKGHAAECRSAPEGSRMSALIWVSDLSTQGGTGLLSVIGYHRIEFKIPLES